ncbi:MAG TPA: DUF1499 domain-containing protein [Alphaproteobacteria bacterium]|nr:DUF1499 domain-containing protein [Alphaproteobacteria bacterium]
MAESPSHSHNRTSRTAITGGSLALFAFFVAFAGFLGLSQGMLKPETGFRLFLLGVALGLVSLAVSSIGMYQTRRAPGRKLALSGVVISCLLLAPVAPHVFNAFSVPPIHDITTDTDNPPDFVDILPLRADAPNPSDYGGVAVAAMQKSAYPDITPLMLDLPPPETFARARKLVEARGWKLAGADPEQGRIEAVAQTRMMKFRDDVVIRITPAPDGSRVDMRSVSRFGQSDIGVNARRIREFLKDLASS